MATDEGGRGEPAGCTNGAGDNREGIERRWEMRVKTEATIIEAVGLVISFCIGGVFGYALKIWIG